MAWFKLNKTIINILIMIVMMILSKFINFDNNTVKLIVRLLYFTSMITSIVIYVMTYYKILKLNDLTLLKYVTNDNSMFSNTAAATSGSNSNAKKEKLVVTTIRDYDLDQVKGSIKSNFNNLVVMLVMHFIMGYTQPLFMQFINPLKNCYQDKLINIHWFLNGGFENKYVNKVVDVLEFKRPFKAETVFGQSVGGSIKMDKKNIELYEKMGNGGVKMD